MSDPKSLLFLLIAFIAPALASETADDGDSVEVIARVTYIASDAVYIDAGRRAGLGKGNRGEILRDGEVIATLELVFAAGETASCKVIQSDHRIKVGDAVRFRIQPLIPAPVNEVVLPPPAPKVESGAIAHAAPATSKPSKRLGRFSGMVGWQLYFQDDLEALNYDYSEPSGYLRLKIADLAGSSYIFNLRLRTRAGIRSRRSSDLARSEWDTRLYEFSVSTPVDRFVRFSLGRVAANRIAGVGSIDGAVAEFHHGGWWDVGVLAGFEPREMRGGLDTDRLKGGVYFGYSASRGRVGLRGTAAVAGIYRAGEIDREFIYLQNDISLSSALRIYKNAEIAINRAWRREAVGRAMTLSALYVNVDRHLNRWLTLSVGVDRREPSPAADSRDSPYPQFDGGARQGGRASVRIDLPSGVRASLGGGFYNADNGWNSRNSSASLAVADILGLGVNGLLRISAHSSRLSDGLAPNFTLSKRFATLVTGLAINGGARRQQLKGVQTIQAASNWLGLTADLQLPWAAYGAINLEVERGGGYSANRITVDLNRRL